MALPVIPATNIKLYGSVRVSCSCSDTTNISLAGLSVNSPTMNYNTISRTLLPSTPQTTTNGALDNWLVEFGGENYAYTNTPEHRMSEFPTGRSVETDGYIGLIP
jgi:hypothetical protein